MAMLLGKKVGMTQVYDEAGKLLPVTVIQAGPCTIMQVKTVESDGYNAVQLGFDDVKKSRQIQAALGHAKKANSTPKKMVREERLTADDKMELQVGSALDVSLFAEAKWVDVIGTSKGKGFAGVMKRHHFGGFPGSHGTERKHRSSGSIASMASDRGHGGNLKKGKRMAGHMGAVRVTSRNHSVVSIDQENNLIMVKGNVAGPAGGYVVVRTAKTKK
ncbi:MAG: 50S ribosomal protein L3 [Planctomycetes bacterium GWC2_49_10]|nr:MAG: 50S ribosomal protein L3 [Planctomycetes bacterium GWC2_49_10]